MAILEESVRIPAAGGVTLAATLWRPARAGRVPAILEVIPYRRGDVTHARDRTIHPVLAAHGFACLRIDMRGSGDSGGVLSDSVAVTANGDTETAIAWAAAQDWCDGQVGMLGISWGGANVIFTAARRPPALKAAVACCFSHDTFQFGMFYRGGVPLTKVFGWATMVTAMNARPPAPDAVPDWRAAWRARLDDLSPQIDAFLGNASRGAYWDNRLIRDWRAVDLPLWLGWSQRDAMFADAVADLLPRLAGPWQATLTPSVHRYPHLSLPGPSVDVLPEWAAFFARAFAGEAAFERPGRIRAFRREAEPPDPWPAAQAAGTWVELDGLDGPAETRELGARRIGPAFDLGWSAGEAMPWCAFAPGPELAGDQAETDERCAVWDWPVGERPLDLAGRPTLRLRLVPDRPVAQVAARLMDVHPDGRATRIGLGLASLNRAKDDRAPGPLTPGEAVEAEVPLNVLAYRLRPGHRLRLALSGGLWPLTLPAPELVNLDLVDGTLSLPRAAMREVPAPPAARASVARDPLRPPERRRTLARDGDRVTLTVTDEMGDWGVGDTGRRFGTRQVERFSCDPADPASAVAETAVTWRLGAPGQDVEVEVAATLRCETEAFAVETRMVARDGGAEVAARDWRSVIARAFN